MVDRPIAVWEADVVTGTVRRLTGAVMVAAVVATLTLLQGCGLMPRQWQISAVTWSPDGHVYYARTGQVWRVRPGGKPEAFIEAFPDRCDGPDVSLLRAFGATGMVVGLVCPGRPARVEAVDLRDRTGTLLFTAENVFDVAVDPSGVRGYVEQKEGYCVSVSGFDNGTVHELAARVPAASGEWRLSDAYRASTRAPGNQGCPGIGRAQSPELAADGRTAMLLVSTEYRPDGDRLSTLFDWRVGLFGVGGDTVRLVGPVMRGVVGLTVSPDGSKVILDHSGEGQSLSVLDVASEEVRPVRTEGFVGASAFSPDGRTIAYSSDFESIKFTPAP
jgi:WD40 repeat protein